MIEAGGAIIAGLSGGLGNQMFQYATARALALRHNAPLVLDLTWFAGHTDRAYALNGFALPASVSLYQPLTYAKIPAIWSRFTRRYAKRRMGAKIFREPHFHFEKTALSLLAPVYLEGYWQSPKYFEDVEEQLYADFQLAQPFNAARGDVQEQIRNAQAVSVHVRRGDYVTNPQASAHHGTCPPEWYQAAMQKMNEHVEKPTFFVFSDDPEWARKNLPQNQECVFVEPQTDGRDYEDMHLMALCNHHIIANSSFSWWGAWLNPDKEKHVFAPNKWFAISEKDTRDLMPTSWVRI